jgi:hypothetical protein
VSVTPFTLVMAYYENPQMLRVQFAYMAELPEPVRRALNVIVIDDGSPTASALSTWISHPPPPMGSAALWRMGVDVRWNQDACRNVGVREAPTRWVLLTDMDHIVPRATWERLMGGKLNKHTVYRFGRVSAPNLEPYKPHPNSWALTAKKYWQIGGYDEALAGNYGTDGDFLTRTRAAVGEITELPDVLVRYPRDIVPDASTTTLERKSLADKVRISHIIKARKANPSWAPRHFSFPCERVL